MDLTPQQENDLLLFWSGELEAEKLESVTDWIQKTPTAKHYLEELASLENLKSGPESSFQETDITALFQSQTSSLHNTADPAVDQISKENELVQVSAPTSFETQQPGERTFPAWPTGKRTLITAFTGGLAIAVLGILVLNFSSLWPTPSKPTALNGGTQKVKTLRSKRKRLQWIQKQTRKNRQLGYRHRSTVSSRWKELRKRKPRKGLA